MTAEIRFSTGISEFDRVLGGGAVIGSLVLVGGAPGIGKSTLLLQMCGSAGENSKILYVTGEESERQLKLRAMRLGIQNQELYILAETDMDKILSGMDSLKPDLVIIDYFECIEPEYGSAKADITEKEGRTMRKFETMAGELDVAIWIPTQGNRDSIKAEVVTNAEVGGSIRKNQIAQVVLSVARSTDDIKNKRATIAVLKNRSGGAGVVLNGVIFDNGTCTISCDNVINFDSVIAYNEYAEEKEAERKENMKNEAKKLYRK
jgi:replicative DNA helicase